MLLKAVIAGLTMDPESNTPIVVLKIEKTEEVVPIWIGILEATSIASALKNIKFDRPMTHDLFKNVIELLGAHLTQVAVTDIVDGTYFARVFFHASDKPYELDARPSDAIGLAVRFGAPIFVDSRVIEKSALKPEAYEMSDDTEEGKKWAEYLNSLSPEDFGKYKV